MQVRVETLADLKRIRFNPFDTVFCVETEKEYFLNLSGGSLTPDDEDIVQAIHGANARYVAMVAKVIGGTPGAPAILDENGKIPLANMPASVFTYKGGWNAATNTPELADGAGTSGETYRVTHAGAVDFGAGAISFVVGDKAVYNGATWEKWDVQDESAAYAKLSDTKTAGTGAGTFTSGAWRTRTINTEDNDSAGIVSLSANQFILQAGTYRINARACAYQVDSHKSRLYNITDSTTTLVGTSEVSGVVPTYASTWSKIAGEFTIAGAKTFEIQHYCSITGAFGNASNVGVNEIYLLCEIWKVG